METELPTTRREWMLQPEFSCFAALVWNSNISVTKASCGIPLRQQKSPKKSWYAADPRWEPQPSGALELTMPESHVALVSNVTCIVCLHSNQIPGDFGCLGLLWYALQKKNQIQISSMSRTLAKNCHWFSPVVNSAAWPAQSVTRNKAQREKNLGDSNATCLRKCQNLWKKWMGVFRNSFSGRIGWSEKETHLKNLN